MQLPCPACGCTDATYASVHRVRAALLDGDVDRAIECGLLGAAPCPQCTAACSAALVAARDSRLAALAARERYRARTERLARRERERAAARAPAPMAPAARAVAPTLPPAAAAALARAKARASGAGS
ncbi:hypothetical protein GCM10007067_10350 [Lysobacter bugurensis]|uniref:Uncharacterized protein n=1 Tax=Cognatilysobacter bugurensis TaxID=543356 RepID=A0A918SX52_9GAMM|nr:hypothetical protein GCM10007067_10350 [Lysobacter bugurensis]